MSALRAGTAGAIRIRLILELIHLHLHLLLLRHHHLRHPKHRSEMDTIQCVAD
jgi:hypothetical protein